MLPTTECCVFGFLGGILEFQEDLKRPHAALSITIIGRIGPLTTQLDIYIQITWNKRGYVLDHTGRSAYLQFYLVSNLSSATKH